MLSSLSDKSESRSPSSPLLCLEGGGVRFHTRRRTRASEERLGVGGRATQAKEADGPTDDATGGARTVQEPSWLNVDLHTSDGGSLLRRPILKRLAFLM